MHFSGTAEKDFLVDFVNAFQNLLLFCGLVQSASKSQMNEEQSNTPKS